MYAEDSRRVPQDLVYLVTSYTVAQSRMPINPVTERDKEKERKKPSRLFLLASISSIIYQSLPVSGHMSSLLSKTPEIDRPFTPFPPHKTSPVQV